MINVLIVDDEISLHQLFKVFFKKEIRNKKINLIFFNNGQECLDYILENDNSNIHSIISDINMPIMDGISLLKIIKEKYPNINFSITSAYDDSNYKETVFKLGANNFYCKPIDFNEIKKTILSNILDS